MNISDYNYDDTGILVSAVEADIIKDIIMDIEVDSAVARSVKKRKLAKEKLFTRRKLEYLNEQIRMQRESDSFSDCWK